MSPVPPTGAGLSSCLAWHRWRPVAKADCEASYMANGQAEVARAQSVAVITEIIPLGSLMRGSGGN